MGNAGTDRCVSFSVKRRDGALTGGRTRRDLGLSTFSRGRCKVRDVSAPNEAPVARDTEIKRPRWHPACTEPDDGRPHSTAKAR